MKYDSKKDTIKHIKRVGELLLSSINELDKRARNHDKTKLQETEKELFDEYAPKLKNTTYGSEEYKRHLKGLGVALKHHYKHNSHHPEHYENGINGFDLFDLIEMLVDWKAATERHTDGDIYKSLEHNKNRFNISTQLMDILYNTVEKIDLW